MPSLHGAGQREIHNDFRIAPFGRNDTADFFYALQNDHQTLFIKKTTNPTSYPNHGVIDHSRHLSTLQVALGFDEQMIETFIQLLIIRNSPDVLLWLRTRFQAGSVDMGGQFFKRV
jgi:hypothetical protein